MTSRDLQKQAVRPPDTLPAPTPARPASARWRVVNVTLALSGVGMVLGAILGPVALLTAAARLPGRTSPGEWPDLVLVGVIGGILFGAVLAPAVAWLCLRRVSFGRAILETTVGILVGIGIGAAVWPVATIWLALLGFVVAAVRLRWMAS
jgi:hypothetical protein